jgi:hypothetical protein
MYGMQAIAVEAIEDCLPDSDRFLGEAEATDPASEGRSSSFGDGGGGSRAVRQGGYLLTICGGKWLFRILPYH